MPGVASAKTGRTTCMALRRTNACENSEKFGYIGLCKCVVTRTFPFFSPPKKRKGEEKFAAAKYSSTPPCVSPRPSVRLPGTRLDWLLPSRAPPSPPVAAGPLHEGYKGGAARHLRGCKGLVECGTGAPHFLSLHFLWGMAKESGEVLLVEKRMGKAFSLHPPQTDPSLCTYPNFSLRGASEGSGLCP